ncbi:hypothetical protein Nepgr_030940 [Nepenthes gracilis]|uniref:Uncharacterized protein n=1 Tax=Nepenthes gracilis TaxID=150966 RepID=A0AAD3Y4C3_NEPGR|nr:hypothetical protein Nepgr_030940 [Nepenthes gracilis]
MKSKIENGLNVVQLVSFVNSSCDLSFDFEMTIQILSVRKGMTMKIEEAIVLSESINDVVAPCHAIRDMRSSTDPMHNVLNLFQEIATHYYSEKQGYQTLLRFLLLNEYKGMSDFLQVVAPKKDQTQCWAHPSTPYSLIPVAEFVEAFSQSRYGNSIKRTPPIPYDKTICHLLDSTNCSWMLLVPYSVLEAVVWSVVGCCRSGLTITMFSRRLNNGQHPFG